MDRRNLCKLGLAGIGTTLFSRPARAAESLFKASEKNNWAIVYATQCGSTKDAATWINEGLGGIADLIDIKSAPAVSDYEFFIIGGWISAGGLVSSVKTFVTSNKAALKDKIRGLFTVCGNNGAPVGAQQISTYLTKQIVQLSEVTDKPAKLFNGRSTPSCGGGNYDLLKKEDCVAFGQTILSTALATDKHTYSRHPELFVANPTPACQVATIRYSLPHATTIRLTVCDLRGKTVAELSNGHSAAGSHEVPWDTRSVSQGCYLCRLEAGTFVRTQAVHVMY